MTNKEKYKQAFSVLQPSGKISLEEERMIIMKKKAKFQAAVAAAAICLAFVSGSGIVYAADLGGVQRKIQLWVQGDQTDADIVYNANGVTTGGMKTKTAHLKTSTAAALRSRRTAPSVH